MEQLVVIKRNGQLQLPGEFRKKLNLIQGDHLKAEVKGQRLVLQKVRSQDRELAATLSWARNAARKLGTDITNRQLLAALKPEFMRKLSEKTQRKIEELGLSEAEIEREIIKECREARQSQKSAK